jgi:Tfp pilus assembly protein PilF
VAPPVRERYAPRDKARTTTRRPSPAADAGGLRPRRVSSSAIATTNTQLTPSAGAPRLGAPSGYATASPRAGSFVGYGWSTRTRRSTFGGVWGGCWGWNQSWCYNGFGGWNNGCYSPFGYGWASRWSLCGWGFGGCNPWAWNVGVLAPYYAWHTSYWNSCYRSAYWTGWSVPNTLPASYWWYPTSTYCPTYLYVPSTVVVVEDAQLEPVVGESTEILAAAGGAPAPAVVPSETEALATKYVELGDFYFKASRYDDAAEAYAKARNLLPDDASVHLVLADAVFANGDYHYAAFLVAEAVRLEPEIVTAETDKRDFYTNVREFDAQVEALQRYCDEKPYDAWAKLLLGYNLRFSARPGPAMAAFRRVLELDRDNPTARAFLSSLEAAEAARRATPEGAAPEVGR